MGIVEPSEIPRTTMTFGMSKTILCGFLMIVAATGAKIDPHDCVHRTGGMGALVYCPAGYVSTGLCASGNSAACDADYTKVKCCRIIEGTMSVGSDLHDLPGKYGKFLICPKDSVVSSVCTSSGWGSCGYWKWTRIGCWENSGLKLSGHCHWIYGYFGQMKTCSPDQVMAGACTSGKHRDCKSYGHGIRCCHVK